MKSVCIVLSVCFLFTGAVGWGETPDYGDLPENALGVPTDGTLVQGALDTDDVDWFTFTPTTNTLYQVTLNGQINTGYKYLTVYQADEFGTLHQTLQFYVHSNGTSCRTFFLESGRDVYLKAYYNPGGYAFYINTLGQYAPDSYGDACAQASTITVDAAPIEATLNRNPDESLDEDWFEFATEPLHMYEIRLTKSDNTDLNFQVFDDACESLLSWSKTRTVMSWFGEPYRIFVQGNLSHLGTYYTLQVVDLGLFPDDYSNVFETACPIAADGSLVNGEIEFSADHHSDEDWFVFTPTANTLYEATLIGELNAGYKYMTLYQIDDFGNLRQTLQFYVHNDNTSVKTFFLEEDKDVYVKLFYNNGGYTFAIEPLGTYPPDSYGDACAAASPVTVDAAPTEGTLTHNPDGSLEMDWFEFATEPLHKYEIRLTKSDNTDLNFQVYSDACEYLLSWSKTRTVMSWFGEPYRIFVQGNPSHLGTYYTLQVVDLGLFPDDYPNTPDDAVTAPKDGTLVEGEIQFQADYQGDEDWFTFIAGQEGDYNFILSGEVNKGYKYLAVFWEDELGVLRLKKETYAYSDNVNNFTVNLPAGRIYLQAFYNLGGYLFSVVSPEPRCGDLDHPYPAGDANKDCYVNLADLALMAENWMTCTDPNPPCVE